MRLRALLVAFAVAFLPPLFVLVAEPIETGLQSRMEARALSAATEASRVNHEEAWRAIAVRYGVHLRVLEDNGRVLFDVDKDTHSWATTLGDILLKDNDAPTPEEFDASLPPVLERAETRGATVGCHVSAGSKILMCASATKANGRVFYATEWSRRAMRTLYDVRYQIVKLALFVLPLALVLGLYLGWRMVRPIEQLTAQVLAGAPASLDRADEFGDLSLAFARLTDALVERTRKNEAFVADLAHEMKNPIAAIRASGEAVDDGTERGARLSRIIGDASGRLDALVTSLLELARAEAGMPGEERERIDLGAFVQSLVTSRPDSARVKLNASSVFIDAAPRRIASVVTNLVDNAVSFGAHVDVRVLNAGPWAILEVEDQGPGIPADVLPKVFDRFFTTRGERRGTGLGLALVKAVVEAHGGTVEVKSSPTTVFRVKLPAMVPAQP